MKEMIYNNFLTTTQKHDTLDLSQTTMTPTLILRPGTPLTRLRPRQPVRSEEAGPSVEAVEEGAAMPGAAVLEATGAAAADACAREHGTPAPAIWGEPTRGGAAGGQRVHARRPSASSWGSWAAGASAGISAATSCPAPVAGPARALPALAGTVLLLGVATRGRPFALGACASGRANLVAYRPAAAEREMTAVAVAIAVVVAVVAVAFAAVVDQTH